MVLLPLFHFCSTGCISDVEITKLSCLLDLLEAGDDVMADNEYYQKEM
jgi:hypothetical protein